MARLADGDPEAARKLAACHMPRVLATSYRILGDHAEAEDVTQEAMLRLWRQAGDWRPGVAKVSTWLYRVTTNLCMDRLRRRKRQMTAVSDSVGVETAAHTSNGPEPVDPGRPVEQRLMEADRATALHAALAMLPDRCRAAVTLRHLEELSNPEIAEIMETSVEAVESLTSRGRRMLAARLLGKRDELGLG